MTEWEIDQLVEFMDKISDSRWDVNPSVEDCASQLRLILGSDRYEEIKAKWATKNQHLVKEGVTKYIHVVTGKLYDGLDSKDKPEDYKKVVM
jgi:L-arabinose isomerase